jgi:hypothetical protein
MVKLQTEQEQVEGQRWICDLTVLLDAFVESKESQRGMIKSNAN